LKTLGARRPCPASPRDAWHALRGFQSWGTTLDTVDATEVGEEIMEVGSRFIVLIHEGFRLECRVTALDPERSMTVSVRWRHLLRAELSYEIAALPDGCELSHARLYGGLVTRFLASIWKAREEEEQSAILREWCWEAGTIAALRRYGH
jgi:hypothetical protein